jgi:hypothetical protein
MARVGWGWTRHRQKAGSLAAAVYVFSFLFAGPERP